MSADERKLLVVVFITRDWCGRKEDLEVSGVLFLLPIMLLAMTLDGDFYVGCCVTRIRQSCSK